MLALTRALAVCGYLRRANAKGASAEYSSDRVRRSIFHWRSARLFDGSLFLSSGATTNVLTAPSFPFGCRSVGFSTLGLEEDRYFRTRDERGVLWSRHASPRPKNVRSIPGDLFDLGRGGSRLDPPLRNHRKRPVSPGASRPSFSFPSERFLSTWQGLGRSHPHLRGRCACDTHPFGENPARSVPFSIQTSTRTRADVLAHQPAKATSATRAHSKRVSSERKNETEVREGAEPRLRKERRGKVEERGTDRRFGRTNGGRKAKRVVV